MKNFFKILGISLILLTTSTQAQSCTLDIGGENAETLVKVFQMNEAQVATMKILQQTLAMETEALESQIENLLAEHPQSTEEELLDLAEKYKVLQQKVIEASYETDKKLLSEFNAKQYDRYLQLCKAAIRRPISVVPKVYNDSIPSE